MTSTRAFLIWNLAIECGIEACRFKVAVITAQLTWIVLAAAYKSRARSTGIPGTANGTGRAKSLSEEDVIRHGRGLRST